MNLKNSRSAVIIQILLAFGYLATAQDYQYVAFPDSNAVWSEYYWSSDGPAVYNKYALFNEDTLINGIAYHKLYQTTDKSEITRENSVCIGGIREDDHKRVLVNSTLFLVDIEKEIMLYDFSKNEGDTIFQEYNNDSITTVFTADYLVVEDVDTIIIHNTLRKVFSFENNEWSRWIEGIGNVQGLIFPSGDLTTGGENSELICMHQNDTLMYFNESYESCVPQFVIDGAAILPNNDIQVYPNPVTSGVINFENIDFETLELLSVNGKLLKQENVKGVSFLEMNVTDFTPGIYFYRLQTKGLVPTFGKLIIQ